MTRAAPLIGLLTASIVLFAVLAEGVAAGAPIVELDRAVAVGMHADSTGFPTEVLTTVTQLGGSEVLLVVTTAAVLALSFKGRVEHAVLVSAALAGGQALNWALKAAFERPRPQLSDPLAAAAGFSFPSGHAMVACSVYGALALIFATSVTSRAARAAVIAAATALGLAIGFSRVYLGVHYVSDVVAGYCAGLAWLTLCALVLLRPTRGYGRAQALTERL
jgi:membrane-associated phospholipid phosphatase